MNKAGQVLSMEELRDYNGEDGGGHVDLPPSDVPAERSCLGALLLFPKAISNPSVAAMQPADFTLPHHQQIFAAARAVESSGVELTPATITNHLRDVGQLGGIGPEYLAYLIGGVVNCAGLPHWADIVVEKSRQRDHIAFAEELHQQAQDGLPPEDLLAYAERHVERIKERNSPNSEGGKTMAELRKQFDKLRPVVIHQLAREGETINVVAPTKTGKSWLVVALALSIVCGIRWLGLYLCVKGKVLILDNELHEETSRFRVDKVADAMGIKQAEYDDDLRIENYRGTLTDIYGIGKLLATFKPGSLKLVILDALYRFLPEGVSENDNAQMAAVYNQIDQYAKRLRCCFVVITHSSKGNQSGKSITDVGAGAGSQSRATDTHIAIRQHEVDGIYSVDAAIRSFEPLNPQCLRFDFPIWTPAPEHDPAALRQEKPRRRKVDPEAPRELTGEDFATRFITETPQKQLAIIDAACRAGLTDRKANSLMKRAIAIGKAHPWPTDDHRVLAYANVPAPTPEPSSEPTKPKRKSKPRKGRS